MRALWLCLILLLLFSVRSYKMALDEKVDLLGFEGHSMSPSLRAGDTLLCLKVPFENLKVGDIVAHYHPSRSDHPLVAHRVIEVSGGKIRTKGDNNQDPDDYYLDNYWYVGKIIGVLFTSSKTWGLENCG